jgi:hypothetical protein
MCRKPAGEKNRFRHGYYSGSRLDQGIETRAEHTMIGAAVINKCMFKACIRVDAFASICHKFKSQAMPYGAIYKKIPFITRTINDHWERYE